MLRYFTASETTTFLRVILPSTHDCNVLRIRRSKSHYFYVYWRTYYALYVQSLWQYIRSKRKEKEKSFHSYNSHKKWTSPHLRERSLEPTITTITTRRRKTEQNQNQNHKQSNKNTNWTSSEHRIAPSSSWASGTFKCVAWEPVTSVDPPWQSLPKCAPR